MSSDNGWSGEGLDSGFYDPAGNIVPDSTGIILHERVPSPGPENQIMRQTAVQSGDIIAADISLHDHEGNPYTTLNPLPTTAVLENPHTVVANIVTAGVPITITAPGSAPIRVFSLYAPRVGPNAGTNSINRYVIYSTDSGSTYKTLPVNEWIAEPGLVTDLRIDASHNGMKVEVEIRY